MGLLLKEGKIERHYTLEILRCFEVYCSAGYEMAFRGIKMTMSSSDEGPFLKSIKTVYLFYLKKKNLRTWHLFNKCFSFATIFFREEVLKLAEVIFMLIIFYIWKLYIFYSKSFIGVVHQQKSLLIIFDISRGYIYYIKKVLY